MSTSDWIQTILLIVTIIGLIITIHNNKRQVKSLNEQLRLNFFADYTKRYQEIILNFPENINQDNFDYDDLPEEIRSKTLRYMRAYFDLCSEEYYLHKSGNLENGIWNNWKEGIEYAFSKKAFQDAWEIICLDTSYYSEFSKWVNIILLKQNLQQTKEI